MSAVASVTVTTWFSPWDDTTGKFLEFINGAKKSLFIVIYGFHLPLLTDLLIIKYAAGVEIGLILDHSQAAGTAEKGELQRLVTAGVPFLIGTSPVHGQILHSKFSVRDGHDVEFGSWNYSISASQQSNTMTFISDPTYAAQFIFHYHRLHAFIMLHDMTLQPAGALSAPDAEVKGSAA
jgi:phosphatidylserine/phosphatidylglycerophosphate/cardiolipin synthase-like enzyme